MRNVVVEIVSFGFGHQIEGADLPPKDAHIVIDLRHHFRDPHINPDLRYMTAHDEEVRLTVLRTQGIMELLEATKAMVFAFASNQDRKTDVIKVAFGCAGGRHRAPVAARELTRMLASDRLPYMEIELKHLTLNLPVIERV